MGDENSVLVRKDYGFVEYYFGKVMNEKNVNRNQLAKRAGIRFEVADRFYHGKIERLDMDVLARVCYVLDCQINEVISYRKPEE